MGKKNMQPPLEACISFTARSMVIKTWTCLQVKMMEAFKTDSQTGKLQVHYLIIVNIT